MLKSVPPPARWFQRTTTTTTMAGGGGFGGQLNHNRCCWRTNSNSMMTMMMSRRGFWTLEGGHQHHFHHRSPKRRHGGTGKSISTRFEERANSTKRWRDECCYDDIYAPSSRLGRSVTNGTTFATRALAENGHDDDHASSAKKEKEEEEEEEDSDDDDEKGGYNKTKHWNPTKRASRSFSTTSETEVEEGSSTRREPRRASKGALESIEGNVFRSRERLKSDKDFDRVKKTGRTLNYSCIRVKAAPNDGVPGATGCHRIGIVVPKKQLKRAVDRNLCKRRVRAIFRTNKDKWPKTESGSHLDFIVFVKQEALEGGFKQVEKEMFLFAHDYAEREMKSKASKSKNAAKIVRNNNNIKNNNKNHTHTNADAKTKGENDREVVR